MDPLLFSLPELILSDMEYPDHPPGPPSSSSYFPPHHLHLAQESAHIHNLESVGPFGPSEPLLATPGPSNSNLRLGPHVMGPHLMGPHLMGPPLVLVPHVLVPVGRPLCCSGPPPLLLLPEVRHTWCSCHRPDGRDPDSRGTTSEGQRAEPEEEEQSIDHLRGRPVPPGCFPSFDDDSLIFEEFMRTVNSCGLKADPTLSAEFLDSLNSAEPVDLLLLGEREPEAEPRDPAPPSPDPVDLLSHRELLLEILAVIQQQLADLSAAQSDGATPGTDETAPATSSVEEPSPWKPDPGQDGGDAPPTGGGTVGPPVPASSRRPEAPVPREEPTPPPAVGEEAEPVRDGDAPGAKTREEEAGRATQRSGNGTERRGRGRGGGEEAAGGDRGSGAEAPGRDWSPPSTRSGAKTRFTASLSTKYKDFLLKTKKKNANRKPARRERQKEREDS